MKNDELNKIIKDCKSGKRKAQQALYNLLSEEMFGICLYYSKDYTEAEDVLHEGFMKVFTSISQFKFKGSLQG
ncbi:MAG: RNA polymerase subunit sigma-70, partial [Bacteroidales bacterium]|nr:RNA polymerase subunit sigma-70 [Bacteroidales bacterium]